MLTAGGAVRGVLVRGVEPDEERLVSDVSQYMITRRAGTSWRRGAFRVLVGSTLATRLGLELGSRVTAIAPEATPTPRRSGAAAPSLRGGGHIRSGTRTVRLVLRPHAHGGRGKSSSGCGTG